MKQVDANELLEWFQEHERYIKDDLKGSGIRIDLTPHKIKEKIQSMLKSANDTDVAANPSDWRVGDRLISRQENVCHSYKKIENVSKDDVLCVGDFINLKIDKLINNYGYVNIDAERRKLEAEIERLKQHNKALCGAENKETAQQPWCFDIDQIPKDDTLFDIVIQDRHGYRFRLIDIYYDEEGIDKKYGLGNQQGNQKVYIDTPAKVIAFRLSEDLDQLRPRSE